MYYKFVKVMLLKIKSHEMEVLSVSVWKLFLIELMYILSDSGYLLFQKSCCGRYRLNF